MEDHCLETTTPKLMVAVACIPALRAGPEHPEQITDLLPDLRRHNLDSGAAAVDAAVRLDRQQQEPRPR